MKRFIAKTVLKDIGCPHLRLYNNRDGYLYFAFDDPSRNVFDTESVYTMRLNDMPLERWVEIGKAFVAKTETKIAER